MFSKRTNGFTLIELLVVISIIAVLAAALFTQGTKARDMAQAMKCKANLHNLAKAALSFGTETGSLPCAGSYEGVNAGWDEGTQTYVVSYHQKVGWVAWTWTGDCPWPNPEMQSQDQNKIKKACYYGDTAYESVTNGVLWSYVGRDISAYTCETHKRVAKREGLKKVSRSYVMNGYFGFDHKASPTPENLPDDPWPNRLLDNLAKRGSAANLLLFAELPAFTGSAHTEKVAQDEFKSGSDSVLETDIDGYACEQTEALGFNHQVAKRYVAHVAFADGHVDVLAEPRGANSVDLVELARQLCNGEELSQEMRAKMR